MNPIFEAALLLSAASFLAAGISKKPEPTGYRSVDFMNWLDVRFKFVVLTAAYIRVVYLLARLLVGSVLWLLDGGSNAAVEFMWPSETAAGPDSGAEIR